ncbi:MAG: FHA domain-containing protein [Verrucomicrobiaceae bacterium]|nr:FHA domain-containing protein [Verrucomicrobiaceae bacterium]
MARIVLKTPEGQMFEAELSGNRQSVGRNDDNDIAIPDGSVSGSHGEFVNNGGTWVFTDLGSTNGTKINGERVDNVELGHGAEFEIGNVAVTFYDESEAPAPAVSAPAAAAPRTMTTSSDGYGAQKIDRAARTGFGAKKVKADGSRTMLMLLGVVGLLAVLGVAALILTEGLK